MNNRLKNITIPCISTLILTISLIFCAQAAQLPHIVRQKTLPHKKSTKVVHIQPKTSAIKQTLDFFQSMQFPTVLINLIIGMISLEISYLPALMQQNIRVTHHDHLHDFCRLTSQSEVTISDDHIEIYEPRIPRTLYIQFPTDSCLSLVCALTDRGFAIAQSTHIHIFIYNHQYDRYERLAPLDHGDMVNQLVSVDDKLQTYSETHRRTWDIDSGRQICKPEKITSQIQSPDREFFDILLAHISQNPEKLKIINPSTQDCLMVERFKSPIRKLITLDNQSFAALSGRMVIVYSIDPKAVNLCKNLQESEHQTLQEIMKDLATLSSKQTIDAQAAVFIDSIHKKIQNLPDRLKPLKINLDHYLKRLQSAQMTPVSTPRSRCSIQ